MPRAVIFDMDGLLIDSEPLWHVAEIDVFATAGVTLTEQDCLATTGLRVDEVVRHWHRLRPWTGPTTTELATAIVERVITLIGERGQAKPGVAAALSACETRGYALALASSSATPIIHAVLRRLALERRFSVVCSAEHEPFGKPHPAVYLSAAQRLDLAPGACVAIEDSPNGVRAAKSAGMCCVAVPDAPLWGHPAFSEADAIMASLTDLPAYLARTWP